MGEEHFLHPRWRITPLVWSYETTIYFNDLVIYSIHIDLWLGLFNTNNSIIQFTDDAR